MLRALPLAFGLALASMVAISGCDGEAAAPVAASARAGKVIEVAGRVTATRGGQARVLATDADVFADDVIETADDGSVVIELAHNGARWSLEGGMRSRVDTSVAWGLERGEAAAVDHATSAAGRHAEKRAADTAATATVATPPVAADEAAESDDAEGGTGPRHRAAEASQAQQAERAQAERAAREQMERAKAEKSMQETSRRPGGTSSSSTPTKDTPPRAPRPATDCDEVACVLDPSRACCAQQAKRRPGGGGASSAPSSVPETPSRTAIGQVLGALRPRVVACGAGHDVHGALRLAIRIAPDGKVSAVDVLESPDPAIDACAIGLVRDARFPRSQRGTTVRYPFSL